MVRLRVQKRANKRVNFGNIDFKSVYSFTGQILLLKHLVGLPYTLNKVSLSNKNIEINFSIKVLLIIS